MWNAMSMEIIVLLVATLVLVLETIGGVSHRVIGVICLVGLGVAAVAGYAEVHQAGSMGPNFFHSTLAIDPLAIFFKYLALLITFVTLLISMESVERRGAYVGEFYALIMYVCAGIMVMASAADLITIFISLELVSIPMYALAASLKLDKRSSEAGLKYFLLGALSSGFYLFGSSLLYACFRSTHLSDFYPLYLRDTSVLPAVVLGLTCILFAFAFKIAVAPFHMWAPDVYQGAPTPVTAYLSTGSKIAGVAVLMRVLLHGFRFLPPDVAIRHDWILVLTILSLTSMVVGNLVALPQKNIKRMLAYSGVSHLGYILIGIVAAGVAGHGSQGAAASMFYAFVYTLTNLGAWGIIIAVGDASGSEEIKDFCGLGKRSPGLAAVLFVAMLSLAGVPPLAGFVGKFYLFSSAWDQRQYLLVIFGIINSVVSLYYYLGVLRAAYFEERPNAPPLVVGPALQSGLAISTLTMVLVGMLPSLTQWTVTSAAAFLN